MNAVEIAVLAGVAVLAWLAWKYPGRSRCADFCENLGRPTRRKTGSRRGDG